MKTQRPEGISTERPAGISTQKPDGLALPEPLTPTTLPAAAVSPKPWPAWEHRQMTVADDFDVASVRDGWELVSVLPEPGMRRVLYFKRRKQ